MNSAQSPSGDNQVNVNPVIPSTPAPGSPPLPPQPVPPPASPVPQPVQPIQQMPEEVVPVPDPMVSNAAPTPVQAVQSSNYPMPTAEYQSPIDPNPQDVPQSFGPTSDQIPPVNPPDKANPSTTFGNNPPKKLPFMLITIILIILIIGFTVSFVYLKLNGTKKPVPTPIITPPVTEVIPTNTLFPTAQPPSSPSATITHIVTPTLSLINPTATVGAQTSASATPKPTVTP